MENNIGIGRELNLPELKVNECYISNTLSNALKVNSEDQIQMEIKLFDLLKAFSDDLIKSQNKEESIFKSFYTKDKENMNQNVRNKAMGFNGILRDYYEKEDDIDNINIVNKMNFNPNKDFKLESNLNDNKKNKKSENNIFSFGPLKHIFVTIVNEYINNIVVDYIDKSINLLNQYLPNKISYNNLYSFAIRKNDLLLILKNIPYSGNLINTLFSNNTNLDKTKLNSDDAFKNILILILRKIIVYNKKYDIIYFNRDLLNDLSSGNLTSFIENNIDYDSLLNEDNVISENITQYFNIKLNLTIKEKIKSTDGKWPNIFGNVLAIDSKHIRDYLYLNIKRIMDDILKALHLENVDKIIWKNIDSYIRDFDINNYTLTINAIFKDKFKVYKKDIKKIRHYISKITEDITTSLGLNFKVNIQMPIYEIINGYNSVKIFLKNILFGIMFFLWILSFLLVNSLMSGNVDERTYEFGMMRALGFKKDIIFIFLYSFLILVIRE